MNHHSIFRQPLGIVVTRVTDPMIAETWTERFFVFSSQEYIAGLGMKNRRAITRHVTRQRAKYVRNTSNRLRTKMQLRLRSPFLSFSRSDFAFRL